MKKFNAFQIKMFMALLMVFDHLNHIPNFISSDLGAIFHVITRCVSVWFAYMLVEGFLHTRSKIKYNLRLGMWALIMYAGNSLLALLYQTKDIHFYNNIFLTLAIGALLLNIIDNFKQSKTIIKVMKVISAVATYILGIAFAEGGMSILLFIFITYVFRENTKLRNVIYIVLAFLLFVMSYADYGNMHDTLSMLAFNSDFMFITVLPFIYLYNGERGNTSKFAKYFFYVFYPAHLWIIGTIAYLVK